MHPLDDIIAYFSLLVKSISEKSGECGSIQPDSRDFAMLNINKYPADDSGSRSRYLSAPRYCPISAMKRDGYLSISAIAYYAVLCYNIQCFPHEDHSAPAACGIFRRKRRITMKKQMIVLTVLSAMLCLSGCGADPAQSGAVSSSEAAVTAADAAETTAAPDEAEETTAAPETEAQDTTAEADT